MLAVGGTSLIHGNDFSKINFTLDWADLINYWTFQSDLMSDQLCDCGGAAKNLKLTVNERTLNSFISGIL